jgi:uncharacterized DUF497 family protein
VKQFQWNEDKNSQIKKERNISFEDIIQAISKGDLLDIIEHYNQDKYPNQRIFIIKLKEYIYLVPFIENSSEIFLKTIIPSRKMKKKYLGD